jgi:hypothetical protein
MRPVAEICRTGHGDGDGNDASRRIVEKLGFQKLRVAGHAATLERAKTLLGLRDP